jgi:hypothetical protein
MSVMPETSQSAMAPYFNSAVVTLALYSRAAVSSSALVVKTPSRRRWFVGGPGKLAARSTGSHCGGHATGWLAPASSLLAILGFIMCEVMAQKAVAVPKRTSARKLEALFFA